MVKKGICIQVIESNQILANSYYENYSGLNMAFTIIRNIINRYNKYSSIRNSESSLFALRLLENYESENNLNIVSFLRKDSYFSAIKDFPEEEFSCLFKDNEDLGYDRSDNFTDEYEDDFYDFIDNSRKKSFETTEDELLSCELSLEYEDYGLIGYTDEDIDLNNYNAELIVEICLDNNTISISGDFNKKYFTEVERLYGVVFKELDTLDFNISGFPFYELEDLEDFIKIHNNKECPYFRIEPDDKFAYCIN